MQRLLRASVSELDSRTSCFMLKSSCICLVLSGSSLYLLVTEADVEYL